MDLRAVTIDLFSPFAGRNVGRKRIRLAELAVQPG